MPAPCIWLVSFPGCCKELFRASRVYSLCFSTVECVHDTRSSEAFQAMQPPLKLPSNSQQPEPHRAAEGNSPASKSPASKCPAFDAKLTKEQLQPFVIQALSSIKPRSCSTLDLTKQLWPEETEMQSCMRTKVNDSEHLATSVICSGLND